MATHFFAEILVDPKQMEQFPDNKWTDRTELWDQWDFVEEIAYKILTPRQIQIFILYVKFRKNKTAIAKMLGINRVTVQRHYKKIIKKIKKNDEIGLHIGVTVGEK